MVTVSALADIRPQRSTVINAFILQQKKISSFFERFRGLIGSDNRILVLNRQMIKDVPVLENIKRHSSKINLNDAANLELHIPYWVRLGQVRWRIHQEVGTTLVPLWTALCVARQKITYLSIESLQSALNLPQICSEVSFLFPLIYLDV